MATQVAPLAPIKAASFASGVMKLTTGSASAQVLTMLTAPLIARLFLPAAFGTAALFLSITTVISAVVTLRYEYSIMLPDTDDEAANSMALSVVFVLLFSTLTLLVLEFAARPLLRLLHAPELTNFLSLAPIAVALNGLCGTLNVWMARKRRFGVLTLAQVVGVIFFILIQIMAGLAGYSGPGTIIVGSLFGLLVQTAIVCGSTLWEWWRLLVTTITPARMFYAFSRYSNFPKYSMGSTLLSNIGAHTPTFFLSAFFSATVVGYYSLGNRLLRTPVNLVGTNVATVFFQHAAEAKYEGKLTHSVQTLFRYLANLIVFPALILSLVGKDVFVVALGEPWAEAGVYTQILSIWLIVWFISMPLGMVLSVIEKQALELRLTTLVLATRIVSMLVGGLAGDVRLALWLFSISGVMVYGYYSLVILRQCTVPTRWAVRVLARSVGAFVPAGVILALMKYFQASPMVNLAAASGLLAIYYANLVRTDPVARGVLIAVVQKTSAAHAA